MVVVVVDPTHRRRGIIMVHRTVVVVVVVLLPMMLDGVYDCPMSNYEKGYNSWYYRGRYHGKEKREHKRKRRRRLRRYKGIIHRHRHLAHIQHKISQRCHHPTNTDVHRNTWRTLRTIVKIGRMRNRQSKHQGGGFRVGSEAQAYPRYIIHTTVTRIM